MHIVIKTESRGKNKAVTLIKGLSTAGMLSNTLLQDSHSLCRRQREGSGEVLLEEVRLLIVGAEWRRRDSHPGRCGRRGRRADTGEVAGDRRGCY